MLKAWIGDQILGMEEVGQSYSYQQANKPGLPGQALGKSEILCWGIARHDNGIICRDRLNSESSVSSNSLISRSICPYEPAWDRDLLQLHDDFVSPIEDMIGGIVAEKHKAAGM